MNCQEFRQELPEWIDSGKSLETEPHLQSCPACLELVRDLQVIATSARDLPEHEPGPGLWLNIEQQLRQEGVIQTSPARQSEKVIGWPAWASVPRLGWAAAAVLVFAFVLVQTANRTGSGPEGDSATTKDSSSDAALSAADAESDRQLLVEVERSHPSMTPVYARNLKNVNTYIADARILLRENPDDSEASEHLREAHAQRAMLYQMATARSLQ